MKKYLIVLALISIQFCSPALGEFGWAVTNDKGKDILEKELFQITDYKMMRTNLIFSPNDTIHYVYKFKWSLFSNNYSGTDEFFVSLEKESLGFVEIELKKKFLDVDSFSLKDKFSNLEIGRYNLKIAYEGEVIDNIIFDILPEEGYSIREDMEDEKDEILKFSR